MSHVLCITGLHPETQRDDIEYEFGRFGRIMNVSVQRQVAHVEFEDERDAQDAMRELNGIKILGRSICVSDATEVKAAKAVKPLSAYMYFVQAMFKHQMVPRMSRGRQYAYLGRVWRGEIEAATSGLFAVPDRDYFYKKALVERKGCCQSN